MVLSSEKMTILEETWSYMFKEISIEDLATTRELNSEILRIFSKLLNQGFKFDLDGGPWIAGGVLTKLVSNTPLGFSDIDIFLGADYGQEKPLYDTLRNNNFIQKAKTKNAISWSNGFYTIQTILKERYKSKYSLLGDFDFTVVKLVSDGKTIFYHKDALADIDDKVLRIEGVKPPKNNLLIRSIKYMNRGYTPDADTALYIINTSSSRIEELY